MVISLFIKSFIAAFLLSMPIGPVNLLCIRHTLAIGWKMGFFSGLGSATADTIYSMFAAFGVGFIINFLLKEKMFFELGGGLFLCYLGVSTYLHVPKEKTTSQVGRGVLQAYAVSFFLTFSNPASALSLMAVFAGLGVADQSRNPLSSFTLVLGVFSGASFWWFTLCSIVSLFRNKFTDQGTRWLNRISGVLITAFGIFIVVYLVRSYYP